MFEVLTKAATFVAIILLGYILRRAGFFREQDFYTLSKLVLKIALPASIVANFSQASLSPSMLIFSLLGFGGGVIYVAVGWLMNARKGTEQKAFDLLNLSGYNIGNFTMPFAQGFLGSTGVVTTSLFDTGNAFVCLGGAYSIAKMIKGGKVAPGPLLKTLVRSLPFDAYIIMTILSMAHISLPSLVVSFAQTVGNANAFLAMLMIGVGFKLSGDFSQIRHMVRILTVRYGIALALALGFYFLLPMDMAYRQALVVLALSPIASAVPAFTGDLGEDVGLSSAINSISIVISIVLITTALVILL